MVPLDILDSKSVSKSRTWSRSGYGYMSCCRSKLSCCYIAKSTCKSCQRSGSLSMASDGPYARSWSLSRSGYK